MDWSIESCFFHKWKQNIKSKLSILYLTLADKTNETVGSYFSKSKKIAPKFNFKLFTPKMAKFNGNNTGHVLTRLKS